MVAGNNRVAGLLSTGLHYKNVVSREFRYPTKTKVLVLGCKVNHGCVALQICGSLIIWWCSLSADKFCCGRFLHCFAEILLLEMCWCLSQTVSSLLTLAYLAGLMTTITTKVSVPLLMAVKSISLI